MKPWCCDRCKAYHQRVVNKNMPEDATQEELEEMDEREFEAEWADLWLPND